jgi:hypothetical protein
MTLLFPERPTDLSSNPEAATSLTQLAGGSTLTAGPEHTAPVLPAAVRAHLAALRDRVLLAATILWLAARLAGLATARLVDSTAAWFAADPRRPRTAVAGLTLAVLVGAAIGLAVGLVMAGCWTVVRSLVTDKLV